MSTVAQSDSPTVATLLVGGRIYTPGSEDATAMAITADTITWMGRDAPGRALHPKARVIDLEGAFVTPAFVDAHVHATAAGLQLTGLDLTACRSLGECLDAIREYVAGHPRDVVWGHGWDESAWAERRPPRRTELDEACAGSAVYLSRIDAHSALVSGALVDLAPDARVADGWSEDGPLTRQAHHHARRAAHDALGGERRRAAQRHFLRHAAARGVATVHECAGPDISAPDDLTDLLALGAHPELPDVVGYWGALGAVETARKLGARGAAGDLFADGALGSRTAALCRPYSDDPGNYGAHYLDAGQIADHLVACTEARMQAGFHVIGDAAVGEVVEGFRRAARRMGATALASCHHRLEHLEMVEAEQARELASYGAIASMQPQFDAAWGGEDRQYAQRLGLPRGTGLNPFRTIAAVGMPLAFGSDTPVTPLDPWGSVRAAVHHHTDGLGISPRAAVTAHTRGGHRAGGDTSRRAGVLTPGAPATYAVWDVAALVGAPEDSKVRRRSTDPRAEAPPLPDLSPQATLPTCITTVLRGTAIYNAL